MRARSTLFAVHLSFVAMGALVLPPNALAWSNGVNGPNTFGTHDWILREAIEASGNAGSWICRREALRATDDPDTVNGIDHASGRRVEFDRERGVEQHCIASPSQLRKR